MVRTTPEGVIAEAKILRGEFDDLLSTIPDVQWRERIGEGKWNLVDIVAHLAYWLERLPGDLQDALDDVTAQESGYVTNQRIARERGDWAPPLARTQLQVAAIAADAAILALPSNHPRLKYALKLAHHEAVEHIATHFAQARTWHSVTMPDSNDEPATNGATS